MFPGDDQLTIEGYDLATASKRYRVPELIRDDHAPRKRRGVRVRPRVTYELAITNGGADIAWRRRCGEKCELLVILVTQQNQVYIKDERTGKTRDLTPSNVAAFLRDDETGTVTLPYVDGPIRDLRSSQWQSLLALLKQPGFRELVKRDLITISIYRVPATFARYNRLAGAYFETEYALDILKNVASHDDIKDALNYAYGTMPVGDDDGDHARMLLAEILTDCSEAHLSTLRECCGLDRLRQLLRGILDKSADLGYHQVGALHRLETIANAILRHDGAVRSVKFVRCAIQLYDESGRQYNRWHRILIYQIRHNVRLHAVYPRDAVQSWDRMRRDARMREDDDLVSGIAERAAELPAWHGHGYIVRPIASVEELLREGESMHNCIPTFARDYASGQSDLFVMRSESDPDTPLIDIEVRGGAVRQAYRACNEQPDDHEWYALGQWCVDTHTAMVTRRGMHLRGPDAAVYVEELEALVGGGAAADALPIVERDEITTTAEIDDALAANARDDLADEFGGYSIRPVTSLDDVDEEAGQYISGIDPAYHRAMLMRGGDNNRVIGTVIITGEEVTCVIAPARLDDEQTAWLRAWADSHGITIPPTCEETDDEIPFE